MYVSKPFDMVAYDTTKRYDAKVRHKGTDQTYGLTYKVIYIILIPPVSPVPMAKPAP